MAPSPTSPPAGPGGPPRHILRGHPTVADTKYGGALAAEDLRWCPRNFLHRFQLRFQEMEGAVGIDQSSADGLVGVTD